MRLRPRMPACALCGDAPSIPNVVTNPSASLPNYEEFCGPAVCASARGGSSSGGEESCPSVSVEEYDKVVKSGEEHLLIDVREPVRVAAAEQFVAPLSASLLRDFFSEFDFDMLRLVTKVLALSVQVCSNLPKPRLGRISSSRWSW